jgi:hypothetical protein
MTTYDDTTGDGTIEGAAASTTSVADRAVARLLPLPSGYLIPMDVMHDFLELGPKPQVDVAAYEKWNLKKVDRLDAVKAILLETHKRSLQTVRSKGYQFVAPLLQGGVAVNTHSREVRKANKHLRNQVINTDVGNFNITQRKAHTDLLAKVGLAEQRIKDGLKETRPFRQRTPVAVSKPFGKWSS